MTKTAQNSLKIFLNLLFIFSVVLTTFIYFSKDNKKITNEAEAVAPSGVTLGLKESLDIDVAEPTGGYINKSYINPVGDFRPAYTYLDKSENIPFGGIQLLTGTNVISNKKSSSLIPSINWVGTNYLKDIYAEAVSTNNIDPNTGQPRKHYEEQLSQGPSGVRGYYFLYNNGNGQPQSVVCQNLNTNRSNFPNSNPLQVLNSTTKNNPIYFRIGRGKVRSLFSANGKVIASVETRIYFENLCAFQSIVRGSACNQTDKDSLAVQKLENVSLPITTLVIFDGQNWITKHVAHAVYKSALLPINNGVTYDLFAWGWGVEGIGGSIGNPTSIVSCNGAIFNSESYDQEFGGKGSDLNFFSLSDVLGNSTPYSSSVELRPKTITISLHASEIMGKIEPSVLRDPVDGRTKLFIYLTDEVNQYTMDGSRGYILRFNSAVSIQHLSNRVFNTIGITNPNNISIQDEPYYRIFQIKADNTTGSILGSSCKLVGGQIVSNSVLYNQLFDVALPIYLGGDSQQDVAQQFCIAQLANDSANNLFIRTPSMYRVTSGTTCQSPTWGAAAAKVSEYKNLKELWIKGSDNLWDMSSYQDPNHTNFLFPANYFPGTALKSNYPSPTSPPASPGGPYVRYIGHLIDWQDYAGFYDHYTDASKNTWFPIEGNGNAGSDLSRWTLEYGPFTRIGGGTSTICKYTGVNNSLIPTTTTLIPLMPFGSGNNLKFQQGASESNFLACDSGGACNGITNMQAYAFISAQTQRPIIANLLAGSFFGLNNSSNRLAAADNSSLFRLIFIGLQNSGPEFRGFTMSCDAGIGFVGNPYRLKFNIKSYISSGTIDIQRAYFVPKNAPINFSSFDSVDTSINIGVNRNSGLQFLNYTISDWENTSSDFILSKDSKNNSSVTSKPTFVPQDRYYLQKGSYSSNLDTTWEFFLELNRDNPFYEKFLVNSTGFDLYLRMFDNLGNSGTTAPTKVASYDINPFESCANLYYKTSNGDFRTYEPGAFRGKTFLNGVELDYGGVDKIGNRIWKTFSTDFKKYRVFNNPLKAKDAAISGAFVSEFTFETPDPGNVPCDTIQGAEITSSNGFCFNLAGTGTSGFRLNDAIDFLIQNENKIKKAYNVKTLTPASPYESWFTVDNINQKVLINLSNLPISDNPKFYIVIDNLIYSGVQYIAEILDSESAPDNVIVLCKQKSCIMNIKNFGSADIKGDIINNYKNQIKQQFSTQSKNKLRLYLNFATLSEKYIPVNSSATTNETPAINIDPARKVILLNDPTNSSLTNYYLGGIITNGFVYSSQSKKTDVIKGFVLSRGIAARGKDDGNKNLYFNDFSNPFLYTDYDPKFLFRLLSAFSKPPEDVKRTYIGLGN